MITITKMKKGHNIITMQNTILKCYFSDNKIWLTSKEISNIFAIKKTEVKKILASIHYTMGKSYVLQTQVLFDKLLQKNVEYYSLDILLSFGYRIDNFSDTKLVIRINRLMQNSYVTKPSIINSSKIFISGKISAYKALLKINLNTSKISEYSLSKKVF